MSERNCSIHRIRLLGRVSAIGLVLATWAWTSSATMGQVPPTHGTPLPGTVGPWRPPSPVSPRPQVVEFRGPEGLIISPAIDGYFGEPIAAPVLAGLLVHPVYRLRVSGILDAEDRAVYPTIELLDCLSPPPGQEVRFPIPIEFTAEDLRLALEGNFVTRVIYVEDPHTAIPFASEPKHENWYDAGPGADPVAEAKLHGRPIAIVRLGGIEPDPQQGPDLQFFNGCPPLMVLPRRSTVVSTPTAQGDKAPTMKAPPNAAVPAEAIPVAPPAGEIQLPAENAAP